MRTVDFSGRTWRVKESDAGVGPGPNIFSAANVVADADGLHLRIARSGRGWTCAEVAAQGTFGHGRYSWTVRSDVTGLDPRAVLGLFTWSDQPEHAHREIDIEVSTWGGRHPVGSGVFTVQSAGPGNSSQFALSASQGSILTMTWTEEEVTFSSSSGDTTTQWSYRGRDVPIPGGEVAPRMNLWLFMGAAPSAGQSVTVQSFSYDALGVGSGSAAREGPEGTWVPTRVRMGGVLAAADPSVDTEVVLEAGRATGRGGVNRFGSTYVVGPEDAIAFGTVASTRMAGPEAAMAQEAALLAALDDAARFDLTDGRLVLRNLEGTILLVLRSRS